MIELSSQNLFQVRVNLGQQSPSPVANAGRLGRQVVVEPSQHRQLGHGLVIDADGTVLWSQRVTNDQAVIEKLIAKATATA